MEYKLRLKKKTQSSYSTASLFAGSALDFDLDFYDVDNIDKIKVPVSISVTLPMDTVNTGILGYDPNLSASSLIPDVAFDFELYYNNSKVLDGNMYIETYEFNNNTPTVSVRLVDKIQDIISGSRLTTFADMYDNLDSSVSFDSFLSSNNETIGSSVSMDSVLFPYVDFCNDVDKFLFASRQFLQFGFDKNRAGFVPALNVKDFIQRFFTEANTGVVSRFFKIGNYGNAIPNINPDDMYMLIPEKLLATPSSVRGFHLVEGPYEYYVNEYTADADLSLTSAIEKDTYPLQTHGWNYSSSPAANTTDNGFGLTFTTNVPNDGSNVDRAYHGSHMSYTAVPINLIAGNRTITDSIGFEMPMIRTASGVYNMVERINPSLSSAKFNFTAVLWRDGSPYERFKMMNTNGTIKEISISDSTVHEMRTSYTVFEGVYTLNSLRLKDYINYFDPQYATELNNRVEFSPSIIGNFNWENKEVEIDAGSTYAVTIDVQWVSGTVDVDYVDTWQPYFNMTSMANDGVIPDNISNRTLEFKDLIKATYAADLSNLGELYLGLSSTGYVNPYYGTDSVNIKNLFDESTLSPFDILKQVIARFNLSVVYDQKTSSVLIDRLPDLRSRNSNESITTRVDDANQISIEISTKRLKTLEIKSSKKGLFYDNYGYKKTNISGSGSEDVSFNLDSRVYNKSLCGDETFIDIPDGFSEYEIGFTLNSFTSHKDIGIVFGYIDTPQYKTNIKRARFVEKQNYKGLLYSTEFSHVFPRFVTDKTNQLRLYHFNEQGQATDLYDFFIGNDNIEYLGKPKIKFSALFDKDYAFDVKDNYSIVTLGQVSSNGLIIKSISGQLYEGGIYGEVEAIIL
jgi:hypothetical protein|tara:strand:+ start:519 stop:3074 length:2556 start_codon:yes stop_codon:yes gene_type:complete